MLKLYRSKTTGEPVAGRWMWNDDDLRRLSDRRIGCVLTYMLNRDEFAWDQIDIVLKEIEERDKVLINRMRSKKLHEPLPQLPAETGDSHCH